MKAAQLAQWAPEQENVLAWCQQCSILSPSLYFVGQKCPKCRSSNVRLNFTTEKPIPWPTLAQGIYMYHPAGALPELARHFLRTLQEPARWVATNGELVPKDLILPVFLSCLKYKVEKDEFLISCDREQISCDSEFASDAVWFEYGDLAWLCVSDQPTSIKYTTFKMVDGAFQTAGYGFELHSRRALYDGIADGTPDASEWETLSRIARAFYVGGVDEAVDRLKQKYPGFVYLPA
jgi:hypothetical protein